MQKRSRVVSILFFFLLLTVACSNNDGTDQVQAEQNVDLTISAAASLSEVMNVIQEAYEEKHPEVTLQFNFGGSGSLQQQISQGAPTDLFFSAAEDKYDVLVEEGIIAEEDGVDLLQNELVLIVPKENPAVDRFEDLVRDEIDTVSMGTPETVPAGKYAKESLEQIGIWEEMESKVVYAKDVRQVLSYVETGNVDAGIVYRTDALNSDEIEIVESADPDTHSPIIYPVGVIKNSDQYEVATQFYEFLQSEEAVKVFEEYGFTTE
jgi:molybdate transport system substrate-binding protein